MLSSALLVVLVTSVVALPSGSVGHLRERQLTAPPLNDFLDWYRPTNISNWEENGWRLTTSTFIPNAFQTQPYVANGYHGSRIPAEGMGYWKILNETGTTQPLNGWPLDNARQTVATISGFWDYQRNTTRTNFPELLEKGGESVISAIPTWSTIYVSTPDGKYTYSPGVDSEQVVEFYQSLSIKHGTLETKVKWVPEAGQPGYELKFTVIAHRERINLGMMKLEITPEADTDLLITDILDGEGAQRTDFQAKGFENNDLIWTSVRPNGIDYVTAFEYSQLDFGVSSKQGLVKEDTRQNAGYRDYVSKANSTISQEYVAEASKGETITVYKYVGISSSDAFPTDAQAVALNAALNAKKTGWGNLVEEHEEAWEALWEDGDVIIHGDQEMMIAVRASLFHLLSNVRSGDEGREIGDNSISVGGLSSDSYAGLVFWDADLWMLPGLLAIHPTYASAINNYRFRLLPQAEENAKDYNLSGAVYPWTSSRFGNCTGTGPCVDYEYHLNNDIALVQWHEFLTTGNFTWLKTQGWPIISAIADMWSTRVLKSNQSGEDGLEYGMYVVHNMTDPDEYANHVDNGAFTNAGVKVIMGIAQQAAQLLGITPPAKWADIENNMFIPYNSQAGLIPEFANMNGSVQIKQADVVLINYPLEFRLNESQALHDLDFYAKAQSADGPAMTWAIFAIDAANLSPAGCATYTYLLYASQPYLRAPYYQFSEQIIDDIYVNGDTNPAFTFLTGHGGFLQVPIHGFLGYRPRIDALYLDPTIPPQLEGVEVKGLKSRGAVYNVYVGRENTTITRVAGKQFKSGEKSQYQLDNNDTAIVRIAAGNEMAGDWKLDVGKTLVVSTRRPDLNGTDLPGNIAQCKPAISDSLFVPGQFPLAAVDGSNSTTWQPATPAPASLTVDLGAIKAISGVSINWAMYPPQNFSVFVKDPISGVPEGFGREGLYHGNEDGWKLALQVDEVEISEPWNATEALVVKLRTGNVTVGIFDEAVEGRWVRLTMEGGGVGGNGGTVAQFGVL
ncbi:alpha,alpha-trehalase ath1 [Rhizina undulata]